MIKKQLQHTTYLVDAKDEVIETTVDLTLRFVLTLKAIKMFEEKTGDKFFARYNKAFTKFSEVIKASQADKAEGEAKVIEIMADESINEFVLDLIPCIYCKPKDGVLLQSELTFEEAVDSEWLFELVSLEFFIEIFTELSKQSMAKQKATRKK